MRGWMVAGLIAAVIVLPLPLGNVLPAVLVVLAALAAPGALDLPGWAMAFGPRNGRILLT